MHRSAISVVRPAVARVGDWSQTGSGRAARRARQREGGGSRTARRADATSAGRRAPRATSRLWATIRARTGPSAAAARTAALAPAPSTMRWTMCTRPPGPSSSSG